MNRLGTVLVIVGLIALGYGGLWQLGLAPGSRVTLPAPVALEKVRPTPVPTVALGEPPPTPVPTAALEQPRTAPAPTVALEDRRLTPPPAAALEAEPRAIDKPTPVPPVPTPAPIHLVPADASERGLVVSEPPP